MLGGAGFVGAHLCRRLVADGHAVVAVDGELRYGGDEHAAAAAAWRAATLLVGVERVTLDVRDEAALGGVLGAAPPDAVVHLANLPLPAHADRDPEGAWSAIVGTTAAVLGAVAAAAPAARVVYASSSMVYGDFAVEPMPERGPLAPRGAYAQAKLAAERAVLRAGLDAVVVRPSAVYGPGDGNRRVLSKLVAAAGAGTPFVVDDPDARLDFTWVGDLADGLARAATVPAAGGRTFNLTRGVARTLAEAAALVAVGVEVRPHPLGDRPRRGALDISRARRILGYAPSVDLEEGLERLAAWEPAAAGAR